MSRLIIQLLARERVSNRTIPTPWQSRGALLLLSVLLAFLATGCSLGSRSFRHQLVTEEEAAQVLEVAKTQLGAPYKWGGRQPPAFDSSGIITWSYRRVIPNMQLRISSSGTANDAPHRDIYRWNFHPLPLEDIRPGDLVYITDGSADVTHGAMFVEWVEPYRLMMFLDASTRVGKVTIQEWPVDEERHRQRFVAAGRLKVIR